MTASLIRTWEPIGPITGRNLATNPSFGTDLSGWGEDAATLTRVTGTSYSGSTSMQLAPAVAGGGATFDFPTTVGQTYTISAYFMSPASRNAQIFASGGGGSGVKVLPAGVWTRITVTFVASNAVTTTYFSSQSTTGVFYLDAVMLEQESEASTYFDGSTVSDDGPGFGYSWDGAADASTSVRTTLVAVDTVVGIEPPSLTESRTARFVYEWLDDDENLLGYVEGIVPGGTLTWSSSARIKGGGSISMRDTGQAFNWLRDRIRIREEVNGIAWPLGVWIPTAPVSEWSADSVGWSVELHDKLTILDNDLVQESYGLPVGTVVTDAVRALIESSGESNIAVTASPRTLAAAQVWVAGTPKLSIINELLSIINYFSLRTNGNGAFVVLPYQLPAERPISFEFIDGETAIYTPEFTVDLDIFNVPNVVICNTPGSDTTEALTVQAINDDPASPFSFTSRGRWIAHVYDDVEAADAAALQAYADKRLMEWSTPTRGITIHHGDVPMTLLDRVRFRSGPADLDLTLIVDKTTVTLNATALAETNLRSATFSDDDSDVVAARL